MVALRGMVLSLIAFRGFTHRKFTMNRRMADKSHTGREKKRQNVRLQEDNQCRNRSISSSICLPKGKSVKERLENKHNVVF